MQQLKLFFAPGACSRVPLIILEKIGKPFETKLMAFMRGDHRSPDFLSLNPSGKIPVLQTSHETLTQNPAILLWLNQQHPQANVLAPVTNDHFRYLQLGKLLRFSADIHPLVSRIRLPHFFCDVDGAPKRVAEIAKSAISAQLSDYEDRLSDRDWLDGEDWTALDAYLHWVWFRITGAGFDPKPFPAIADHFERTMELSPFKKAIERERVAETWLEDNGFAVKFPKPA